MLIRRTTQPAVAARTFAAPVLPLLLSLPVLALQLPGAAPVPAALRPATGTAAPRQAPALMAAISGSGPYLITPERRALLNTIRYAEGTWTGGSHAGYRMLYGGSYFADLARHPELVVSKGYSSAAAGAYQFLPGTWNEAARRLKLSDFRPASQDQAALYLVEKRGALARFDHQGLSEDVLARLAAEWSSLPTLRGGSYYGQPVKDVAELQRFYSDELLRQRGQAV